MKRRTFFKTGAVATSLAALNTSSLLFTAACGRSQKPRRPSRPTGLAKENLRSQEYLRRVRAEKYLTKHPVYAESKLTHFVKIMPMPPEDRIRKKIVPRCGFCSLAPGGEALISGNGSVNIELACNPYTEQIPFNHESLFIPRRKSSEAPKIAHIFPQVRQTYSQELLNFL